MVCEACKFPMNGMHVKKRNRFTSTHIQEIFRLVAGLAIDMRFQCLCTSASPLE